MDQIIVDDEQKFEMGVALNNDPLDGVFWSQEIGISIWLYDACRTFYLPGIFGAAGLKPGRLANIRIG